MQHTWVHLHSTAHLSTFQYNIPEYISTVQHTWVHLSIVNLSWVNLSTYSIPAYEYISIRPTWVHHSTAYLPECISEQHTWVYLISAYLSVSQCIIPEYISMQHNWVDISAAHLSISQCSKHDYISVKHTFLSICISVRRHSWERYGISQCGGIPEFMYQSVPLCTLQFPVDFY